MGCCCFRSKGRYVGPPRDLEIPLLADVSETDRRDVFRAAEHLLFPLAAEIFAIDAPAERAYLLASGTAVQYGPAVNGRLQPMRWLKAGDTFGEMAWVHPQQSYIVTTVTRAPSCAWAWSRGAMRAILRDYAQVAENSRRLLADIMARFVERRARQLHEDARTRVARALVNLGARIGELTASGVMVRIDNRHLAKEAGVNVWDVSGYLQEWQRAGKIEKGRGWVLLRSSELLT